jgi:hypothetical protein
VQLTQNGLALGPQNKSGSLNIEQMVANGSQCDIQRLHLTRLTIDDGFEVNMPIITKLRMEMSTNVRIC